MWVTGGVPVTHLRKMMLEELQRRNYAETTIDCYIRTVEDFSRRFHLPPDRLGPRHIREYQAELFQKQKLATPTMRQRTQRPGRNAQSHVARRTPPTLAPVATQAQHMAVS